MTKDTWFQNQQYKSLVGLLQENRKVSKEFQKKNKGFKIAMITEVVLFAAMILIFVIFGMRGSSRDTRNFVLIFLLAICLFFVLLDVFLWFTNIYKPKKDFIKKAKAGYPGVDLSSESSMKNYLWTLKNRELLVNLMGLIVWEGAIRNAGGFVGDNTYTKTERVVLDAMRTKNIDHELYYYFQYAEHVISYLEGVIDSFYTIGADDEAKIWTEARELFTKLEILDEDSDAPEPNDTNVRDDVEYYIYALNGDDGEAKFAFTEAQRTWLTDLKYRHSACRVDTEMKLYDYVMEHKDEFKFGEN